MPSAFVDALIAAMPTPQARLACLSVVARFEGRSVYIPRKESKAKRRQRAAAHMLSEGTEPGDVVNALRERFGVSKRSAWRSVKTAKDIGTLD